MSAHQLHHKRLPWRVHPHRLRQLLSKCDGGRETGQSGPVGHGRTGGLRPAPPPVLPSDGRLPDLLLPREPGLLRERPSQVVPGGSPPLPQHAHHPGGHQAGPAGRQGRHRTAEGQEAVSHHLPTGTGHGQGDWCGEVPGVLGADPARPEDRLRRGHPSRPLSSAHQEMWQEVHRVLRVEGGASEGAGLQVKGPVSPGFVSLGVLVGA